MWITRLTLIHFRNYAQEDLRPSPGANVFLGSNAQGKSNLVEAVTLLSTSRSFRTSVDSTLINRSFLDEPIVHARVAAELHGGPYRQIELVITQETTNALGTPGPTRKHLRLDGAPHRLLDGLGVLPTVLFTPEDVSLVGGAPAGRRRFLDVLLCQASREYCRALGQYNRALTQRNHLLRLIRRRRTDPEQLYYWDRLLAGSGAEVTRRRATAIAAMRQPAAETHSSLASEESLAISYCPGTPWRGHDAGESATEEELHTILEGSRQADLERGVTTAGPHRDDLAILIDGSEAASFASRGQMRTAALTLRLVEGLYLEQALGRRPILLFDDVMSELDSRRRRALESVMVDSSQSFITGLDAAPFTRAFLRTARVWTVCDGAAGPLSGPGEDVAPVVPLDADTGEA